MVRRTGLGRVLFPLTPARSFRSLPLSMIDKTREAGVSLSSFGGEGWGEEALNNVTAPLPLSNFRGPFLEPVPRVAGITASSPRPSPPKEERGPTMRALLPIAIQTQWQRSHGERENRRQAVRKAGTVRAAKALERVPPLPNPDQSGLRSAGRGVGKGNARSTHRVRIGPGGRSPPQGFHGSQPFILLSLGLCRRSLTLGLAVALAALPSHTQSADDKQATFFMGRVRYSANDGNDCTGVGQDLMKLVSRASTLKIQEERKVRLTDPDLYETPFLFMNGHNDFVFSPAELENLKKYLSHGGFFFSSGCCTNPGFPSAWRREFSRIFPNEKVRPIPYDHLIYRSFYRIDRVRCLNEARNIQLEGLFYEGNLVAVMCEDGLCCSFSADNKCNEGKGINPDDGQKLTLNIAVYALTH